MITGAVVGVDDAAAGESESGGLGRSEVWNDSPTFTTAPVISWRTTCDTN